MIHISHEGKTALITGGAKGIGSGISTAFARSGANVIMVHRSPTEETEAFAARLQNEYHVRTLVLQGDMSSEEDVLRVFDQAEKYFGRTDILVNNAGSLKHLPITELDMRDWSYYLANNLTAYFLATREFGRRNKDDGKGGHIVNVLSKSAFSNTSSDNAVYVVNKHGELGLTRSAAVEYAPYGIRVNAVVPGFVWTSMTRAMGQWFTDKLDRAPMKRACEPEELGETVAFITSDHCRLMVGSVVDLSEGLLLGF